MTRDEEIKQYCEEQGFPLGSCSSVNSIKATIASDAIKWADEHPKNPWHPVTELPKEVGLYVVIISTPYNTHYIVAEWTGKVWWSLIGYNSGEITHWMKIIR